MKTIIETLNDAKKVLNGLDLEQAKLACGCRKHWACAIIDDNKHLDIRVFFDDNLCIFLSYAIKDNNKLSYECALLLSGDDTWQLD